MRAGVRRGGAREDADGGVIGSGGRFGKAGRIARARQSGGWVCARRPKPRPSSASTATPVKIVDASSIAALLFGEPEAARDVLLPTEVILSGCRCGENPQPTPLRGVTFSHKWEKDAPFEFKLLKSTQSAPLLLPFTGEGGPCVARVG